MTLASLVGRAVRRTAPSLAADHDRLGAVDRTLRRVSRRLTRTGEDVEDVRRRVAALERRALDPVEQLRALLTRVEPYQPLYGLPDLVTAPSRPTLDRAEVIAQRLAPLEGRRVFDVGSSLGYLCLHLADRGATTLGWDFNARNVAVARAVADLNGIPAEFAARALTPETVGAVERWRPDAVLLLSVLHHVVYYQGLEEAQDVVRRLAAASPVLVLELARADEDRALPWAASQPDDPLEVLSAIEGSYRVEDLGQFDTHLSPTARPLLAVVSDRPSG